MEMFYLLWERILVYQKILFHAKNVVIENSSTSLKLNSYQMVPYLKRIYTRK